MKRGNGQRRIVMRERGESDSVGTVELFFDLVFVFALTRVTAQMADDPTATGIVRGVLVVALLWWAWVGFAWVGNVARTTTVAARVTMLVAMAAMFLMALCIPEAFEDAPGGLDGPLVLAASYAVLRVVHLVMFWILAAGDRGLHRQLLRFLPTMIGSTGLLFLASQLEGPARTWAWVGALAADYAGTYLGGAKGWRIRSAHHFSERHSLIVIVALGESIVALGVGVADLPISAPIIFATVAGLTLSAALWWTYFDELAERCGEAFAALSDDRQPRLARDTYSLLHLPVMVGVVLAALGLKKVLEYAGDQVHHQLTDPLKAVVAITLVAGVALYLLAQAACLARLTRVVDWPRVTGALLLLVGVPLVVHLPAIAELVLVAGVVLAVVAMDARRSRTGHALGSAGAAQ